MAKLLSYLIPRDKKFFPLFQQAANNLVQISLTNYEMTKQYNRDKWKEYLDKMEKFEHQGDFYTHEIFKQLGSNFITPFDREDIHSLTVAMDDVADYVWGSAKRMEMYKIEKSTTPIQKLSEIILQATEEINVAISHLQRKGNHNKVMESNVKINSLENHADNIYELAMAQLFEDERNPIELIKMKDVLTMLEKATDKCEDVANVLESIVIKYS